MFCHQSEVDIFIPVEDSYAFCPFTNKSVDNHMITAELQSCFQIQGKLAMVAAFETSL